MLRKVVFLLLTFLLLGASAPAQTAAKIAPPPAVVDGKVTPNLIPDHVAYRMVLLSFSVPQNPTATDIRRQTAHLTALGLNAAEMDAAKQTLRTFREQYDLGQSRQKYDKTTNHRAFKKNLVQTTLQQLSKALTSDHMAAFTEYARSRKSYIVTTEVE